MLVTVSFLGKYYESEVWTRFFHAKLYYMLSNKKMANDVKLGPFLGWADFERAWEGTSTPIQRSSQISNFLEICL